MAQNVCAGVYNYKGVTTSQLDDFCMVSNFFSQPLEVTAHVLNDGSHWDSEIEEIAGRLCFLKEKQSWKSSLPPANMSPSGNELARIKDMYNHFNERSGQKAPSIADDVYEIIMKVI